MPKMWITKRTEVKISHCCHPEKNTVNVWVTVSFPKRNFLTWSSVLSCWTSCRLERGIPLSSLSWSCSGFFHGILGWPRACFLALGLTHLLTIEFIVQNFWYNTIIPGHSYSMTIQESTGSSRKVLSRDQYALPLWPPVYRRKGSCSGMS